MEIQSYEDSHKSDKSGKSGKSDSSKKRNIKQLNKDSETFRSRFQGDPLKRPTKKTTSFAPALERTNSGMHGFQGYGRFNNGYSQYKHTELKKAVIKNPTPLSGGQCKHT